MRLRLSLAIAAGGCFAAASAFVPSPLFGVTSSRSMESPHSLWMAPEVQETPCDIPENIINVDLVSQKGSGNLLRNVMLTDVDGMAIRLGDKMGGGTSVQRIEASGASGPLFISIGNAEMLNKFLELNPNVPRTKAFVDDYTFGAYKAVGIGSFEFGQPVEGDIKLAAPKIGGFGGWWNYTTNVAKLSPIEEGKPGLPEGVKRLGGTFVVKGDNIVYQWNDKVPGDQPDLEDVMKVVQDASHS